MTLPPAFFLILASLISSSTAQIVVRRRRNNTGRIIAGCVVGAVFAFIFLCLFLVMLRKRRARQQYVATTIPGGTQNQFTNKPMFGGPWGRSNNTGHHGAQQAGTPMAPYAPQAGYHNATPVQTPQANYNPEYPSSNAPLPPPAYGKDVNEGTRYEPPSGAPPPTHRTDGSYAPPLGPPPAAHTTGQDNGFIGGFRN
ncbi:hypothetical protein B0H34DRAFT_796442 [Crassisporium funariophilum]|nr:hypothetical protein B0H34DRAFT_796442 [Crassisporium funariophilum]